MEGYCLGQFQVPSGMWLEETTETTLTHATKTLVFLISNFRRVLNIVYVLFLGISPASDCSLPTFRNPLSVPSSKAGCGV